MKWALILIGALATGLFSGCATNPEKTQDRVASQYIKQGGLVIDVRTPEEYNQQHLPGAINIPLNQLAGQIRQVAPNPTKPLLVHCQGGGRAGKATQILHDMGYTNVLNLGSYSHAQKVLESSGAGAS